jgi:hypothetical protein
MILIRPRRTAVLDVQVTHPVLLHAKLKYAVVVAAAMEGCTFVQRTWCRDTAVPSATYIRAVENRATEASITR